MVHRSWLLLLFFVSESISFSINVYPKISSLDPKIRKAFNFPDVCGRIPTPARRARIPSALKAQVSASPGEQEWDSFLLRGDDSQLYDLLMEQRLKRAVDGEEISMAEVIGDRKALVVFMRHVG